MTKTSSNQSNDNTNRPLRDHLRAQTDKRYLEILDSNELRQLYGEYLKSRKKDKPTP